MTDRLMTDSSGAETSGPRRADRSSHFVLHSPSSTFYLTTAEALRLRHELEMALNHGTEVVIADVEMQVDGASELLGTLQRSLNPTHDWVRFGF